MSNSNSPASSTPASSSPDKWSAYQRAVFADFEDDTGHTVVEAGPGSGKTTTTIEGMKYIPSHRGVLAVAFNKSIQQELQRRAPRGVDVKTFHSVGLLTVKRAFGDLKIDENKTKDHADNVLIDAGRFYTDRQGRRRGTGAAKVAKLAGYAKNMLVEETDIGGLIDVGCNFGLDDDAKFPIEQIAKYAGETLARCANDKTRIDFDDMVWFPARHQLRSATHDVIVIDETQDANAAQLYLARSLMRKNGRIVAVGDPWQAIYAFRGADQEAMPRIKRELNARVLPLSISYRCAKAIVDVARGLGAPIEAAPNAEAGLVEHRADDALLGTDGPVPGDFVLSRTNAPLLKNCLHFLAKGIPACVAGRDVGRNLIALIDRANTESVTSLLMWIEGWRAEECERAEALEKPERAELAIDLAASIEALAQGERNVQAIREKIERLFRDEDLQSRIVFSSVHKAKGLERDRVFLIASTFRPKQNIEERNIYYVAITRAKRHLIYCGNVNNQVWRGAK